MCYGGQRCPPLYTLKWDSVEHLFKDLRIISCKRNRIIRSPAILKRISAGLRIKCDVGTEMSSTLYAKMWFCGASSQDLRIISCKRNGTIRNFAILKCISADLRIISNKRNQFIRKCRIWRAANLQTAYKMCRGDGDTSAIIRKNEILGHAFTRVRIIQF